MAIETCVHVIVIIYKVYILYKSTGKLYWQKPKTGFFQWMLEQQKSQNHQNYFHQDLSSEYDKYGKRGLNNINKNIQ